MLDVITTDDVIRAGACADGVADWYAEHGRGMTAMPTRLALAACETDEDREHILRAAEADGDGFGDDDDGDDDDDDFGDDFGNDFGNGNGYGNGYGYGNADGNGNGYGYGNADGNGGLLYHHTETP